MKQIITLIAVFALISGAVYAQDQQAEPDFYTQQLNAQETMAGMDRVIRNAHASGAGSNEFDANALDRILLLYPNINMPSEFRLAYNMARTISARLGAAQYTEAGPNLWRVVENMADPLARGEALNSLGLVGAVDFLPQVIQLLTDINSDQGRDPMPREQVAIGAIGGLRAFADPSAYLSVFFVTVGWYSERAKAPAREALPLIMNDPTEPLLSVIQGVYPIPTKLTALQVLQASQAGNAQKAQGAVAALAAAHGTSTIVASERSILMTTRYTAIRMITEYGTEDAEAYALLRRSYNPQGAAIQEERLLVIAALEALASDESVRLLGEFLADLGVRNERGTITPADQTLVRAIIPALGNTRRPSARVHLNRILQDEWSSGIIILARNALANIP